MSFFLSFFIYLVILHSDDGHVSVQNFNLLVLQLNLVLIGFFYIDAVTNIDVICREVKFIYYLWINI